MKRAIRVASIVGAAIASAGCQLFLPSGDGGAGGETSSSKSATTDASSGATGTTGSSTAASSTASGGPVCDPSDPNCTKDAPFAGCGTSKPCGSNDGCNGYCDYVAECDSKGAKQFGSNQECCAVCEYVRGGAMGDITDNLCCRANAAAKGLDHTNCTAVGPFGVAGNAGAACGSQSVHVCELLFTLCSTNPVATCTKLACKTNYSGEITDPYEYGQGANGISKLMDATLAIIDAPDKTAACTEAMAVACPPPN